ncbi:MAG: hypothetical protein Q8P56_06255 [Candidatus Uhrbacteria bacterium]|nr:hypothetical protein [Candidatus Uhrbacteria bacterium]
MEEAQHCSLIVDKTSGRIENITIEPLLKEFGSPLFVVSERVIREKYRLLADTLKLAYPSSRIAYSFKTNYVAGICGILKESGALAEVVSGFEYWLAKRLGYAGVDIIFNGPYKRDGDLLQAVNDNCMLNIDNWEELERLDSLMLKHSRHAFVGLRLNVNHGREDSKPWSRFGFNIENGEAYETLFKVKRRLKNIAIHGIHLHIGTNIEDPLQYKLMAEKTAGLIAEIRKKLDIEIKYVDLGGGFPVYGNRLFGNKVSNVPQIEDYIHAIVAPIRRSPAQPLVLLEPGRFLVAEGICLLTTVVSGKKINNIPTVTVDSSTSFLREASFIDHKISALKPVAADDCFPTVVFGYSCTQHDILGQAKLPILGKGDILAIHNVGAYSIPRSSQWIFPRPAIVSIGENGKISVLRRKEKNEDMVSLDKLPFA